MMETMLILMLIATAPFVVYLSAKLARYGWLQGEHTFKQNHKENTDGHTTGT